MTPADALVPLPVSVICYLHLYAFFRFNKRRPGFSVTFMDGLFKKKIGTVTTNVCKNTYIYIFICMCASPVSRGQSWLWPGQACGLSRGVGEVALSWEGDLWQAASVGEAAEVADGRAVASPRVPVGPLLGPWWGRPSREDSLGICGVGSAACTGMCVWGRG